MDRREQMRRWLMLREERGLTFRELSKRTGVPAGTLGCWSWKLRREGRGRGRRRRSASGFVELVAKAERETDPIEIVLASGRRLVIRGEIDELALQRVVRALERC
jgi:hypothetical protein